jgi:hypothetical protein
MMALPTNSIFMFATMRPVHQEKTHNLDPDVWFIFNLHRESSFSSSTNNSKYNDIAGAYYPQEKVYTYLERRSLAHGGESLSSPEPCLKSTAFMPLAPAPAFPPAEHLFTY